MTLENLLNSAWHAGYNDYEDNRDNSGYWLDMFGDVAYNEYLAGRGCAVRDY